jgi:LmbE family N-acetylglucosaminyl deacetylase
MSDEKLRVLGVGAHPDDLEILAGGTLARYAAQGHEVFMAVATDGSAGHATIPPDELVDIRRKEFEASAESIGAQTYWIGEPDEFLFHDRDTRMKFIEAIRWANPQVIITHNPDDYHPDHRVTADLVFAAAFVATIPNIRTELPPPDGMAAIFYMDSLGGVGFQPELFVDITETYEKKLEMLKCHDSQVTWLQDHDNIDILDFVDGVAQMRGLMCSVKYAEGFKAAWVWPRIGPEHMLP